MQQSYFYALAMLALHAGRLPAGSRPREGNTLATYPRSPRIWQALRRRRSGAPARGRDGVESSRPPRSLRARVQRGHRRQPAAAAWQAALIPPFMAAYAHAARRAARDTTSCTRWLPPGLRRWRLGSRSSSSSGGRTSPRPPCAAPCAPSLPGGGGRVLVGARRRGGNWAPGGSRSSAASTFRRDQLRLARPSPLRAAPGRRDPGLVSAGASSSSRATDRSASGCRWR
jgi:hypothetical protein